MLGSRNMSNHWHFQVPNSLVGERPDLSRIRSIRYGPLLRPEADRVVIDGTDELSLLASHCIRFPAAVFFFLESLGANTQCHRPATSAPCRMAFGNFVMITSLNRR